MPQLAASFGAGSPGPHSRAGWALTVGSLCKDPGSDGREEDNADNVAPVILNKALELLDLLLNSVPLVLLPPRFRVQMQLVLVHPGKHSSAGVTTRFPWQASVTEVTCRAHCQRVISGQPALHCLQKLVTNAQMKL